MIKTDKTQYKSENILSEQELKIKIGVLKKEGKKIGMCSGSFDLLHPGHIIHLVSAKKMCDVLVVCIATDDFNFKKHYTDGRPIYPQEERAYSVSKLKPVDFVVYGNDDTFFCNLIKPDVYIKGPDYIKDNNPEMKDTMTKLGGVIKNTDDEKQSTTYLIKYIKEEVKI